MRTSMMLLSQALVLSCVLVPTEASSKVIKQGAKCNKSGAEAVSKGLSFRCTKKGKSLIWVRNSVNPVPTITAFTTPAPTPTPVISISPTPAQSISPTPSPTPTPSPSPTSTVKEYTRTEVSQRNTASSCWTIVDGNVYDLTSWINSHPGGPGVIRSLCGVDGSASFRAQHGRSARPNSILDGYLLGPLKR